MATYRVPLKGREILLHRGNIDVVATSEEEATKKVEAMLADHEIDSSEMFDDESLGIEITIDAEEEIEQLDDEDEEAE